MNIIPYRKTGVNITRVNNHRYEPLAYHFHFKLNVTNI